MKRYERAVIRRAVTRVIRKVGCRRVRVPADRGFADVTLCTLLTDLRVTFVIRMVVGLCPSTNQADHAWSRLFALFAVALLGVASLATRLLLRRDPHARALLRRVASRRRGRCALSLISAMISLLHQEPGLYDHLAPRIKLKLDGDLANVS